MRLERPRPLGPPPRVSVVVPCYNYGHFLPEAVGSALDRQPGVEVDVVVVDDASPDGSGEIAQRLADADPRVRVIRHRTNAGHVRTFNDGLHAVDGDYVVLLSADDRLSPGSLGRSAALLEAHPSVGFVYGYAPRFTTDPPAATGRVRSWGIWPGDEWYRARARRTRNPIFSPEVVMRHELVQRLGYYDLDMPHTSDLYLWLRAAQVTEVGRVNGPAQAYYRVHGHNMHLTRYAGILVDLRERAATWDKAVARDPFCRTALRTQARRGLAREAIGLATGALDRRDLDAMPVAELAELGRELWPGITGTVQWDLFQARRRSAVSARVLRGTAGPRTLTDKLAWRRWRRYGTW